MKSLAAFVVGVGLTEFVADDPEITDFAMTRFTLFLLICGLNENTADGDLWRGWISGLFLLRIALDFGSTVGDFASYF